MNPKQFAVSAINKIAARARKTSEEGKYRQITSNYDLNGYKRVYLVHIRKTGGTSLNNMFLSLSGEDSGSLYYQLANSPDHRICVNGLIYVGWNVHHINKGTYFYGFSHTPLHELDLPRETFTVSCFRDPVKRIISHFNMLMEFRTNNIDHPCMVTEGKWLGDSFDDFLDRIPREHLLNQLYMFSSEFNIDEATKNAQRLSHYFFSDAFYEGINHLNEKTGLSLEPIHIRKGTKHTEIPQESLNRLRDLLGDEYKFLGCLRESQIA